MNRLVSAIYAFVFAVVLLVALALVDMNDSRFEYPVPVITYKE
ncbi:hypothetical protein SAMN05192560_2094 [Methylobacillus rhizosphaerae]|uniref:Uncharacterized protein n=1 Tax=Methylobacillus rhizosphaerae TaxID=551994 RepID=A0A239ASX9_9PROT|nr:hypothetical protein SAMN05192560_2094 [Methylobacillus rhizosphaerae]